MSHQKLHTHQQGESSQQLLSYESGADAIVRSRPLAGFSLFHESDSGTRASRADLGVCPTANDRYSWRSAAIGSILDALRAGK